jgi:low affinity Fe/Cu permease
VEYIEQLKHWASQYPRWLVILCVAGAIILVLSIVGKVFKWSMKLLLLLALAVLAVGFYYWLQGR